MGELRRAEGTANQTNDMQSLSRRLFSESNKQSHPFAQSDTTMGNQNKQGSLDNGMPHIQNPSQSQQSSDAALGLPNTTIDHGNGAGQKPGAPGHEKPVPSPNNSFDSQMKKDEQMLHEELANLKKNGGSAAVKKELHHIEQELKQAKKNHDPKELEKATKELDALAKSLSAGAKGAGSAAQDSTSPKQVAGSVKGSDLGAQPGSRASGTDSGSQSGQNSGSGDSGAAGTQAGAMHGHGHGHEHAKHQHKHAVQGVDSSNQLTFDSIFGSRTSF